VCFDYGHASPVLSMLLTLKRAGEICKYCQKLFAYDVLCSCIYNDFYLRTIDQSDKIFEDHWTIPAAFCIASSITYTIFNG
jgi:hypothetical protein